MKMAFMIITLFSSFLLVGQNKVDQIEEIMSDYLSPNGPGIAILISRDQNLLYENAFGLSDISLGESIRTDHLFRIGSITKQFTAVAILKLAYENKLNLDDPIDRYLSNVTMADTISVKQLLQHTSGLGNQSDMPEFSNESIDLEHYPGNMIQRIVNTDRKFPPGTNYAYSNLGYIILGYIIENVSGMSFEAYLTKMFFNPLDMKHTGFEYVDKHIVPNSKGYSKLGDQYEVAAPIKMKIAYAAGGLVSNLRDLEKWNMAFMTGKILPLRYVSQIQESGILPNGKATGYSLGWQIGNIHGLKTVKHDGIVNGFTSMTIYVPEKSIFITTLSNCDCFSDIENPTSMIAALYLDQAFPSESIELSYKELDKFQGKYINDNSEMIIAAHDSILMYYSLGGEKRMLIPVGVNIFQIEGSLDQIEFHFKELDSTYTFRSLNEISQWKRTKKLNGYSSISLGVEELEEYIGKYQVPNAFLFEVVKDGNKLFGQIGNDRKEIFCYDTDKFCARSTDALLEFYRDGQGKILKLDLNFGRKFTAEKGR